MSNALAIASVTAVLKDLLNDGLINHDLAAAVGDVVVTALPPDQIDLTGNNARSQLNLFLYQVTPNTQWRNHGLPVHSSQGDRLANAPLALDLHFLLTAYGVEEFHSEILLGHGMHWLHETPILTKEAIRAALAPPTPVNAGGSLPAAMRALSTSGLGEQIDSLRITPNPLTTEELSKLWTAFQSKFRPSAAYEVSVVLIQGDRPTRRALPVRARRLYAQPLKSPVITEVRSQESVDAPILPNQPILADHRLALLGSNLRGEQTLINVGGIEVFPDPADITDNRIVFALPAGVAVGIVGVQVIHEKSMGSPPVPHVGVVSNLSAFVLRPRLLTVGAAGVAIDGDGLATGTIEVTFDPPAEEPQRVTLFLNELPLPAVSPPAPPTRPRAYSFDAPALHLLSPPAPADALSIPFDGVIPGAYLVRLQIDGAESPLETSPEGLYDGPQVTIA